MWSRDASEDLDGCAGLITHRRHARRGQGNAESEIYIFNVSSKYAQSEPNPPKGEGQREQIGKTSPQTDPFVNSPRIPKPNNHALPRPRTPASPPALLPSSAFLTSRLLSPPTPRPRPPTPSSSREPHVSSPGSAPVDFSWIFPGALKELRPRPGLRRCAPVRRRFWPKERSPTPAGSKGSGRSPDDDVGGTAATADVGGGGGGCGAGDAAAVGRVGDGGASAGAGAAGAGNSTSGGASPDGVSAVVRAAGAPVAGAAAGCAGGVGLATDAAADPTADLVSFTPSRTNVVCSPLPFSLSAFSDAPGPDDNTDDATGTGAGVEDVRWLGPPAHLSAVAPAADASLPSPALSPCHGAAARFPCIAQAPSLLTPEGTSPLTVALPPSLHHGAIRRYTAIPPPPPSPPPSCNACLAATGGRTPCPPEFEQARASPPFGGVL